MDVSRAAQLRLQLVRQQLLEQRRVQTRLRRRISTRFRQDPMKPRPLDSMAPTADPGQATVGRDFEIEHRWVWLRLGSVDREPAPWALIEITRDPVA